MWIYGLVAGVAAGLTTILLVPQVIRIASTNGAVDRPGGRKQHAQSLPRLGGLAILAGLVAGLAAALPFHPGQWLSDIPQEQLYAFLGGVLIILLVGVVDDLKRVSSLYKFAAQLAAAVLIVSAGWSFHQLQLPFVGLVELGLLGPLVSVLWVVGITNAINLMDGLDGLASGMVCIISMSLLIFAMAQGNACMVILTGAMAGACLGFLIFNWSPARIFMGDSGSLTLGFLLAALSLHASLKASAAVAILVPLLALGLPAIDTLLVMAVRFLARPHHPLSRRLAGIFKADRRHVHFLALSLAPKRSRVVIALYSIVFLFCLMAVTVALSGSSTLGFTLLLVEIGAVVLIRTAGLRAQARALALARRQEIREVLEAMEELAPAAADAEMATPSPQPV